MVCHQVFKKIHVGDFIYETNVFHPGRSDFRRSHYHQSEVWSVVTLISVHLPKTAGTSFRLSLREYFGEGYRDDYADGGLHRSTRDRCTLAIAAARTIDAQGLGDVACIHGHFMPVKYLLLSTRSPLTYVTWLRDPIERLLSHYYYWQESYDKATSAPHHRQVIEEGWTLEQFCLSERFRNLYTQYLWGFPLESFAFIGITEFYREDIVEFGERFLGHALPLHRLNASVHSQLPKCFDKAFLQRVRAFHSADVQLYRRAVDMRSERHREGLMRRDVLFLEAANDAKHA
ncbi:hypothetical protein EKH79_03185 [Dyella dinghuensis]|uniref:Sulfotransferase family protein n=1 Tax=Dyella dinghuensis TaxID=1920169 RepID=A0A432LXH7_9GAMM|nr:sulfotransferase family 2 domain-containing protein [Dyella dinghuensis]RUL66828.1 hypothetical protein EKH79_03185 [Dyella dinghuensis]